MSFFSELSRRNVLRVAAAYIVVAWVIVQAVVTLREVFPETPIWIVQALLVFLVLGVVPVLTFSWFYELTPEGFRRDEEVGADRSYSNATGRRLIYVTVVAVFVGVALFAWTGLGRPPPVDPISPTSIVVLPFANMSSDPENEYFSDGLADTLIHMLGQVKDFKVISRTSSDALKGQDKDIREIARIFAVAYVLEGSVQRAGDRLRITAQLIRAKDESRAWSQNYDRTLDDVFAIQDEIAGEVGTAIMASILGPGKFDSPEGVNTSNVEAFDLYLRARAEHVKGSHGSLDNAEGFLNKALAIDPGFLEAKIELAWVVYTQATTGMRINSDAYADMLALADQVLDVDASNTEALFVQTWANLALSMENGDFAAWEQAKPKLRTLVAESPNNVAQKILFAWALRGPGNLEEALQLLQSAAELDPRNAGVHLSLHRKYRSLENWDAARQSILKAIELEPESPTNFEDLAWLSYQLDDVAGYLDGMHQAMKYDADDWGLPSEIATLLYRFDLFAQGDVYRDRSIAIAPNSIAARGLELQRAIWIGESDAASLLARQVIKDQLIGNRAIWDTAGTYLIREALANGKVAETIAFIDRHSPGFADLDDLDVHMTASWLRNSMLHAFGEIHTREEMETFINRVEEHYMLLGFSGLEGLPVLHIGALTYRGQTEQAIEVVINEFLSKPKMQIPGWKRFLSQPRLAEVVADPRVQEALLQWDDEELKIREEIRAYLAKKSR